MKESTRQFRSGEWTGGRFEAGCYGCGRVDPCGYHYTDCTLLEPGDGLVERGTERVVGYYDGPDMRDTATIADNEV